MMKDNVFIFDLKNTLVDSSGTLMIDPKDMQELKETADVVLYSIAEPWTFTVLQRFEDIFAGFSAILLVVEKKPNDLVGFKNSYERKVVIGDGKDSEIAVARLLGLETILVSEGSNTISAAIATLKDERP